MITAPRAFFVAAVVVVATLGEGGASAASLLAQHLLIAAALAAAAFGRPAGSGPARGPAAAWLAFAFLAAAGAFAAPYAYAAWLVLVEVAAFGAVAWLASGAPAACARILPSAVALAAAAHGVIAVAERLRGSPRPASTFLNPNHLAAWLAAAALLLAGRLLDRDGPARARALDGAALTAALAGIFVTGSRGAVVGIAAGAAVLVAMAWPSLGAAMRRRVVAAVAVGVIAVGAGVAVRFRSDDDPYRFHRTRIWRASLAAVAASPWRGTGPGQFAAAAANLNFPNEATPLRYERGFRTPHSDLLRAICEFGLPAGLAAFAAAALLARGVVRRRAATTAAERGAFAALVALGAQATVDDLSTRPALALLAAALAGWLAASPREGRAPRLARAFAAALAIAVFGVGEAAGAYAWSRVQELPRGPLDPAQRAALAGALRWNPWQPDYWERVAEDAEGNGRDWTLADYARAREAAEHATRLQPADASYARGAARVAAHACLSILPFAAERERAARLYEDAQALARTDATLPLEEAKFLLQAGDAPGARRAAEQALRIEPGAPVPRLWLARAILTVDGSAGAAPARRLVDEAERLAPRPGETPASPYDAALRGVDPAMVASLRAAIAAAETP